MLKNSPLQIYYALDKMFEGSSWLEWEPEVLAKSAEVEDKSFDKVAAVQAVAANSNMVVNNAVAFENVVLAFNNNIINPELVQLPFVEEIMYAINQIKDIITTVHGEDVNIEFKGEVPGYIAAVAKERGWVVLPKRLSFAQDVLFNLTSFTPQSPKFKEHKAILSKVFKAIDDLDKLSYDSIINELEDVPSDPFLHKVIGAYLFDPCVNSK